jgi:glutathione synthase
MVNEIMRRDGDVFVTTPAKVYLMQNIPKAYCKKVTGFSTKYETGLEKSIDLKEFQVIHLRVDPPFDIDYYYMTIFLEMVANVTLIVNSPESVRSYNEKLIILNFPQFITDTIVTSSAEQAKDFIINKCNGRGVVKNLGECSSRGIILVDGDEEQIKAKVLSIIAEWNSHIMIQKYIPEIKNGETRITMINGEAKGWVKKVPKEDSFLASLDFGAKVIPYILSEKDKEIVQVTGKFLKEKGIILASLDVIDGNLSEINITSPGLLKHTNEVMGIKLESILESSISEILREKFL